MNFAVHALFAALCNSGLWFFHNLRSTSWDWLPWITASWVTVLLVHLIYISAIADYSDLGSQETPPKST
jgi:branched-subunit amino acid transport protein